MFPSFYSKIVNIHNCKHLNTFHLTIDLCLKCEFFVKALLQFGIIHPSSSKRTKIYIRLAKNTDSRLVKSNIAFCCCPHCDKMEKGKSFGERKMIWCLNCKSCIFTKYNITQSVSSFSRSIWFLHWEVSIKNRCNYLNNLAHTQTVSISFSSNTLWRDKN